MHAIEWFGSFALHDEKKREEKVLPCMLATKPHMIGRIRAYLSVVTVSKNFCSRGIDWHGLGWRREGQCAVTRSKQGLNERT
jgi:hypothetical protein